jgi:thiol-disulfide isomerase/thioredoxin
MGRWTIVAMWLVAATIEGANGAVFQSGRVSDGVQLVNLRESVGNIEYEAVQLVREAPENVTRGIQQAGDLWYGGIARRFPGESPSGRSHFVPFAVLYREGVAKQAWLDQNLDGDLNDDPPIQPMPYPGPEGTRGFLTDLRWNIRVGPRSIAISWKLRILLDPLVDPEAHPVYHEQRVYAMVGTVLEEGKPHRAFLYDGNCDGLYTMAFGDGLFVDLNDDLKFDMDRMSPEFEPLAVPFQMKQRSYRVMDVDPEGRWLKIQEEGVAAPIRVASVGETAPDFWFDDLEGQRVRLSQYKGKVVLVYFWATWCGTCAHQARPLRQIYDSFRGKGVEILGVSYDSDRVKAASFVQQHRQVWPVFVSGRMLWENSIGRLYHADRAGVVYLIDRESHLDGVFDDLVKLRTRLVELLSKGTSRPEVDHRN